MGQRPRQRPEVHIAPPQAACVATRNAQSAMAYAMPHNVLACTHATHGHTHQYTRTRTAYRPPAASAAGGGGVPLLGALAAASALAPHAPFGCGTAAAATAAYPRAFSPPLLSAARPGAGASPR